MSINVEERKQKVTRYSEWIRLWRVVKHMEAGEGTMWEPLEKSIAAYRRACPGCWVPKDYEHQNPYHEFHKEDLWKTLG